MHKQSKGHHTRAAPRFRMVFIVMYNLDFNSFSCKLCILCLPHRGFQLSCCLHVNVHEQHILLGVVVVQNDRLVRVSVHLSNNHVHLSIPTRGPKRRLSSKVAVETGGASEELEPVVSDTTLVRRDLRLQLDEKFAILVIIPFLFVKKRMFSYTAISPLKHLHAWPF